MPGGNFNEHVASIFLYVFVCVVLGEGGREEGKGRRLCVKRDGHRREIKRYKIILLIATARGKKVVSIINV